MTLGWPREGDGGTGSGGGECHPCVSVGRKQVCVVWLWVGPGKACIGDRGDGEQSHQHTLVITY